MPIVVDTSAPTSSDFKKLLEEMVGNIGSNVAHQDTSDAVATIASDTATTGSTQNPAGAGTVACDTDKNPQKRKRPKV